MTVPAHISVPLTGHFDATRRARAERGARGAHKRWGTQQPWSAYVLPAVKSTRCIVRWRRRGGKYHQGSVDTREEADAIIAVVSAALRAGITPPSLPRGRAKPEGAQTSVRSNDEIAQRRLAMRKIFDNPERCEVCTMLKPCYPCTGDVRAELLSARRGGE